MIKSMMQHSVGPGIAPRSCFRQSSSISSSHGVPMNSNAKYSIRCDAAPSRTIINQTDRYLRFTCTNKATTYVKTLNSWLNDK